MQTYSTADEAAICTF